MNRYIFAVIAFVAMLFTFLADASACGRCGIFGRGCRFAASAHHVPHVAAKEVVQRDVIQNLIFNNIAPPGDLAPRGTTVYGLSRALEFNAPNSALYLDNARRSLEVSSEFTSAARGLDSEILDVERTNARGRAVEAAFRALREDTTETTRSTTTTIRLRNGVPVFDEQDELPPVPRAPLAVGALTCTKCHGPEGKAFKAFPMDGPITFERYLQGKAEIEAGRMPPNAGLNETQQDHAVLQLGRLVGGVER